VNELHFTIIIPAYNCERWVNKNLSSAINQKYTNYEVVYIDDASTDSTLSKAQSIIDSADREITLIKNLKNKKALHNVYNSVHSSKEGTIIVTLDADDWLVNEDVLQKLNELYQKNDPWITAGSYIDNALGRIHRPTVTEDFWNDNIRKKEWSLSHLRSFRRELFTKIKEVDLIDFDGEYYKYTWDRAIMYPMVEMAGPERFLPVTAPLYIYNMVNPISVHRVAREEQLRIEDMLKRKAQYSRLTTI